MKGVYRPVNPDKCKSDHPIFRSIWERLVCVWCDKAEDVAWWSIEGMKVPYEFEGKQRTYIPDFLVEFDNGDKRMIEVKPSAQRAMDINKAKWAAARQWCEENGWGFVVLTEKELYAK